MPLDWLNTPLDADIGELIAQRKRGKAIEALRAQVQGRLAPSVNIRLQLADLLIQAGRGPEAIPVLVGLADEFSSDGFVAKAVAILKRVEKLEPDRPDVRDRLTLLVHQQKVSSPAVAVPTSRPRMPEIGIEEVGPELEMLEAAVPGPLESESDGALPVAAAVPDVFESTDSLGEPSPTSEPELLQATDGGPPSAEGTEQSAAPADGVEQSAAPADGVAHRIRRAFRRFLWTLPGGEGVEAPAAWAAEPSETDVERELVETSIAEVEPMDAAMSIELEPVEPELGEPEPAEAEAVELVEETISEPEPEPPVSVELEVVEDEVAAIAEPTASEPPAAAPPLDVEPEPLDTLSEAGYQEQLLDIVEDVLQRPVPPPRPYLLDRGRTLDIAERLLASRLLGGLDEGELLAVVQRLRLRTVEVGDIVVSEGEPGEGVCLVAAGAVKVFVTNPDGRNFEVAVLGEGDFFGEISSLSGRPRTATIVAARRAELLELDRSSLDDIARTHPRVRDVLENAYIERASSPEVAAVRAVVLPEAGTRRRAIEVLEAHFGESRWDPRMRLRLADVLVKAGKDAEAVPILIGLADDLSKEGYPDKAVAILKKIELLQRRNVEVVNLAPLVKAADEAGASRPRKRSRARAGPAGASPLPSRNKPVTDDRFHGWLLELVRDTVRGPAAGLDPAPPEKAPSLRAYGPGLRANPLFEDFSEEELLAFIQGLRLLTFDPGDVIITEGEPGQSIFILAAGLVKVFVRGSDRRNLLVAMLGEGSFFGEISTLSGQPRTATITAGAHCDILEMDRATLDSIASAHPRVRIVLEQYSSARLLDPAARRARGESPAL